MTVDWLVKCCGIYDRSLGLKFDYANSSAQLVTNLVNEEAPTVFEKWIAFVDKLAAYPFVSS